MPLLHRFGLPHARFPDVLRVGAALTSTSARRRTSARTNAWRSGHGKSHMADHRLTIPWSPTHTAVASPNGSALAETIQDFTDEQV